MDLRVVSSALGLLLYVLAGLLAAPVLLAAHDGDVAALRGYATSAVLVAACAVILRVLGGGAKRRELHRKDAFAIVSLIWVFLGLFGALPFLIEGSITSWSGALFEAVSGFTTTGATVVADVDGLSRATNLWRCEMHWVGGMGIVVLFVAIFPNLGVGAKQLFFTEAPGPTNEGLRPRIRATAAALGWIYLGRTAACGVSLWLLGLGRFDALCHAMSTLGTGGFSTRTASLGAFPVAAQWVVALFMLLAGLNFGLYHALLRGRLREVLRNAELRFYLGVNAAVALGVVALILPRHEGLLTSLRHATFQVLAVTTTTGFMTEDFDTYPDVARWVLLLLMFMGGCAGSTAGGIKASRILLLVKLAVREVRTAVQPHEVSAVRLGRQVVPPAVLTGVLVFTTTFFALFAVSATALAAMGLDLVTAASASIACLSSIGPGLAAVGPSQSYALVPAAGKVVLCGLMIAGRLELFTLLALLSPECWRR